MEFPELLKKATIKLYADWTNTEKLGEEEKKKKFGRRVRVDAKYVEGLRKELRSGGITWYSDLSKSVGGKGEFPGPLEHFLSGLPLCQMSHYAERALVWGIKLDNVEMTVTGHFTEISRYPFHEIRYEARIASPENPEKIKKLATAAQNDCYVTNTLKRACRVIGRIFLNGELLMEI